MRKLLIVLPLFALAGCGGANKLVAHYKGYSKECIEGVTYLQFPSGATVQVDITGKPVPCQ